MEPQAPVMETPVVNPQPAMEPQAPVMEPQQATIKNEGIVTSEDSQPFDIAGMFSNNK